jgi:hypothetical protein
MKALLMLAAAMAQPAAQPCLTTAEAEALATVALPDILRQTGVRCAAALPAGSVLRQADGALLQRYTAEADRAWPAARGAIAKLADPSVSALLESELARPLLLTLVTPQIVGRIAVKDCGTIDRLVGLLAPLPPRNVAGVIVTALRHGQANRRPGDTSPQLPLCPVAGR